MEGGGGEGAPRRYCVADSTEALGGERLDELPFFFLGRNSWSKSS